MIPRIKICGITRLGDAMDAVDAGASAIGFVFVSESPRYIDPRQAAAIVQSLPPFVVPVGVVADTPREDIMAILEESGVAALQFHGEEEPVDLEAYPVPTYKAFRVGEAFDVCTLARYRSAAFLLDTYVVGLKGGTGKPFAWSTAIRAKRYGRIILAGGISSANIVHALQEVKPYAIDVSSGVETSPGIKDRRKLQALFTAVNSWQDEQR